ncbi:sensory box histidine kinase/response regulator, partial [hydrothermal vent metagenome]
LRGKPTYVMAPALKDRHEEWLQAIQKSPDGIASDIRLVSPKGNDEIWARVHCAAQLDDDGLCYGYRGVGFDITTQKQAEIAVVRAKEAAEQAAEERARFLSTMSHEIRTPLNAVIGMTDLLLDSEQPSEQAKLTKTANRAGLHLLGLVNDILDHSKLEAGKVILEEIPFDPAEEINNVCDILEATAADKNVALGLSLDRELLTNYQGDPARIRQILLNLVGNAIKFTEDGQIAIRVLPTSNNRVRFEIKDSGIGISEQAQKTLFDEFSQADASTTRKHGGTGLGLAICKRLIEVMGGEIGVHSTPGEGSTFWFEIPLQQVKKTAPNAATDTTKSASKLQSFKILVAEDNPANQLLIRTLLEKLEQNITIVENGQLAVEAASAERFDLIFMDMQMPVMDGYTAARTLRDQANSVPIIALTAHVIGDEIHKFKAAGINDWLSKPFQMKDLVKRLIHWGNLGREQQPAPKSKRRA